MIHSTFHIFKFKLHYKQFHTRSTSMQTTCLFSKLSVLGNILIPLFLAVFLCLDGSCWS